MIIKQLHSTGYRWEIWVGFVAALSFMFRFWAFSQTPYATGWDSYFYLIQLRAWLETGSMHSPEASLIYPFFALMYWFTGSYIIAFKTGAALLTACFSVAVMLFFKQQPTRVTLMAGCWTLLSPHLTWFAAQFPKNLMGIVVLILFLKTLDAPATVPRLMTRGILLTVQFFIHRMTFGLALLAFLLRWGAPALSRLGTKRQTTPQQCNRNPKALILLFLGVCLIFVWLSVQFPGVLHWSDAARWHRNDTHQWHFPPYLFITEFGAGTRMTLLWKLEVMAAVLAWVGLLTLPAKKNPSLWVLAGLGGVLILPLDAWHHSSLSFRFVAAFVLFLPIFLIFYDDKNLQGMFFPAIFAHRFSVWKILPPWLLVPIVGFCTVIWWPSYRPDVHDPPYPLFSRITDSCRSKFETIGKPELIIAHPALAEFITFTTGIDAMPWLPEYPIDSTKLWRISTDVRRSELYHYSTQHVTPMIFALPANYFLMSEWQWQQIVRQATLANDTIFLNQTQSWRNPARQRPAYLLRRKKWQY